MYVRTVSQAAHGHSAVYAFQFGNELYTNVAPQRYGADLVLMSQELHRVFASVAPGARVPSLVGPDNGIDDMSAEHVDAILNASADVMEALSYHDYWNVCVDDVQQAWRVGNSTLALNVSCIDARVSNVKHKYGPSTSAHSTALWLTEGALHANSGVAGMSHATFHIPHVACHIPHTAHCTPHVRETWISCT